jgi:tRNA dimethylallyltransferase
VQGLLEQVPAEAKPFGFLGYKQLAAHLQGEFSLEVAVEKTQHETRQYSRRQMTWFRKETGAEWIPGFGGDKLTLEIALNRIRQFLGSD